MDSKVSKLVQAAKPLSAATIAAFFNGTEAERAEGAVAKAEQPRLLALFASFGKTDVATVKSAMKDWKKVEKGDKAEIPQVVKQRASEMQSLYGAFVFCGLTEPAGGYHATVEAARHGLKAKKIRWDGARVAEKWESAIKQDVERNAAVELDVRMAQKRAEQEGKEFTEVQEKQVRENAEDAILNADLTAIARGLFKKYGERCNILIEKLEGMIASAEQEAANKQQVAA